MIEFSGRVWGKDHLTEINLYNTEHGLELTADVGDQETTVVLDPTGVRHLRLTLQKYEYQLAQAEVKP